MFYINGRCQPAMQYGSCAQGHDKMDTLYFIFFIFPPCIFYNVNLLAPEFGIQILAHPVCKM